jgi:uncharacterized membrane protein
MAAARAAPFTVGEAISFGWDRFKANFGPLAIVALVVWGVEFVLNLLIRPDTGSALFVTQMLYFVLASIIAMGWITISLEVVDGRTVEVSDVWKHIDKLGPYILAAVLFGVMFTIGLVLLIIPGILVAVTFAFYGFCILDRNLGAIEGLKRSAEITRGYRGQLFLFGLALIGLNLLGLLLLIIGVLVTSGISLIAAGYVYRKLDASSSGTGVG